MDFRHTIDVEATKFTLPECNFTFLECKFTSLECNFTYRDSDSRSGECDGTLLERKLHSTSRKPRRANARIHSPHATTRPGNVSYTLATWITFTQRRSRCREAEGVNIRKETYVVTCAEVP